MGNDSSRSVMYAQYRDALHSSNTEGMRDVGKALDPVNDLHGLDPYKVLGVSKTFTFDELKNAYRRVARAVHPDKGGSEHLFQAVTDCFRELAHQYKLRTADRPHHELKSDALQHFKEQTGPHQEAYEQASSDDTFIDRFNKMFDGNRLVDEDDDTNTGYGHVMAASSKNREDFKLPRKQYTKEGFNKAFDETTIDKSKEVIVYREPESLPLSRKVQCTEIGAGRTDDYSNTTDKPRQLGYTDYMKAHTTSRLVDPRAVKDRAVYKDVNAYEADRSRSLETPPSDEELLWRAEQQRNREAAETRRLQRVSDSDRRVAAHHARVSKLMLRQ